MAREYHFLLQKVREDVKSLRGFLREAILRMGLEAEVGFYQLQRMKKVSRTEGHEQGTQEKVKRHFAK